MRRFAIAASLLPVLVLQGCGGGASGGDGGGGAVAPTVTLSATPSTVFTGDPTTLNWSSTDAGSCNASGAWSGAKGTSGAETTAGLTANRTFTLTCLSPDGTVSSQASATVTVTNVPPPPALTLGASPANVLSSGSSTLAWSSTYATSCTASGDWTGPKATSGSEPTGPLTTPATYTLSCTGTGGSVNRTVTVAVTTATVSYSTNFDATENPISEGGRWHRAGNAFTNVRTANGLAFGTNGITDGYDDSYALLSGFGPDQTAEAMIVRSPGLATGITHEVELLLRMTDDATGAWGYECLFGYGGNIAIVRWYGEVGNFDVLPATGFSVFRELITGDVVKASIVGNLITLYLNGTEVAHVTDNSYPDALHPNGQPGISFFTRPGGNSANFAITSYTVISN
jgi:hypothetical protein